LIQGFDLICLQETWLRQSNKISFKNYVIFRNDRSDMKMEGGSMIICKKFLNLLVHRIESENLQNCDITMISIVDNKLHHERIYFVSFYKPSNIKFRISYWREFLGLIDSITLASQSFILGDFNSQNISWRSTKSNLSGCIYPGQIPLGIFLLFFK